MCHIRYGSSGCDLINPLMRRLRQSRTLATYISASNTASDSWSILLCGKRVVNQFGTTRARVRPVRKPRPKASFKSDKTCDTVLAETFANFLNFRSDVV